MNREKEISNVVDVITSNISVKKIILFGSYAYGTPDSNSDLDFCIVTDEKNRKLELLWQIRALINPYLTLPCDLLVYKEEEFEQRALVPGAMENMIYNKGILLYGK